MESGDWELRTPESRPQPFMNERIKHATTETSRATLAGEMRKTRGGELMQLMQRRTFFKSKETSAKRTEKNKKMIFGFSCKDGRQFRQEYFRKSLVVPAGLRGLREDQQ